MLLRSSAIHVFRHNEIDLSLKVLNLSISLGVVGETVAYVLDQPINRVIELKCEVSHQFFHVTHVSVLVSRPLAEIVDLFLIFTDKAIGLLGVFFESCHLLFHVICQTNCLIDDALETGLLLC